MNQTKKIKLISILSVALVPIIPLALLTSCSSANYAFGNFESYMSPNVINKINSTYKNINWQYYSSNFQIPTYLQNKTLNAAIATNNMAVVLAKKQLISKIDYSCFNLLGPNKEMINNNNFNNLLNPNVKIISEHGFTKFGINNLSDYGIPYFLQNLVFCYRGSKIPNLHKPNVSFIDILNEIKTNPSFKSQQLTFVDDPRLIYGLSEIIQDLSLNQSININPNSGLYGEDRSNTPNIDWFKSVYQYLLSYLQNAYKNNKTSIALISDSNTILNQLARNEIKGAFLYNGDAIYAALGGDYHSLITPEDFHVVIPKDTINALDYIVFNANNTKEEQIQMLKLAYNISLSGSNSKSYNEYNTPIYDGVLPDSQNQSLHIADVDANDDYKYLSMQNFDYVNYTPTLNLIYQYALNEYFSGSALENELKKLIDIKIDVNHVANYLEMPLNDLANSNIKLAYLWFKNNL